MHKEEIIVSELRLRATFNPAMPAVDFFALHVPLVVEFDYLPPKDAGEGQPAEPQQFNIRAITPRWHVVLGDAGEKMKVELKAELDILPMLSWFFVQRIEESLKAPDKP